jgi:hypothetical protein
MNRENNGLGSSPQAETGGIIYNVTIKVEQPIAEVWLQWILREHIPDILKTKCFTGYKVVRLLEVDDSEGPTYAIQYTAASRADYNRYIEQYATEMRQRSFEKWGGRFIAFRTVMQVVQ